MSDSPAGICLQGGRKHFHGLAELGNLKDVCDTDLVGTHSGRPVEGGRRRDHHGLAVQAELGIPVKFIGVGEKIEDLQKFNPDQFVDAIFY